jgi:hypothetical protein
MYDVTWQTAVIYLAIAINWITDIYTINIILTVLQVHFSHPEELGTILWGNQQIISYLPWSANQFCLISQNENFLIDINLERKFCLAQ